MRRFLTLHQLPLSVKFKFFQDSFFLTDTEVFWSELNELKQELAGLSSNTLGTVQRQTFFEEHPTVSAVEERIYVELLQIEKTKNDQLSKWVANLKMQLKIEKMRERESVVRRVSAPAKQAAAPAPTTSPDHEDKEYIKQLLAQIQTLSSQLKEKLEEEASKKPEVIIQKDPKHLQQIDVLEKQLKPLQQKVGDLGRENMMVTSRNRELLQKLEEVEKSSYTEAVKQTDLIETLESELKVLRSMNKSLGEKNSEKEEKRSKEREREKKISELETQNKLLQSKLDEIHKEMEALRLKLQEEKNKTIPPVIIRESVRGPAPAARQQQEQPIKTEVKPTATVSKPKQAWEESKPAPTKKSEKPEKPVNVKKKQIPPPTAEKKVVQKSTVTVDAPKAISSVVPKKKVTQGTASKDPVLEQQPNEQQSTLPIPEPRPELAKVNDKPPLFRSKSLPSLPCKSATTKRSRTSSLPIVFTLNYHKRDKPFREWMMQSYLPDREKVVTRVERRWTRFTQRLSKRSEKEKLYAQEKGSKYFTFAIKQLSLPTPHHDSTIRNVFEIRSVVLTFSVQSAL